MSALRSIAPTPPAPLVEGEVSVWIARPSPALQSYITFYYVVDVSGPLADFLYPEWGNVRFGVTGRWYVCVPGHDAIDPQVATLYGPTDRHGMIETDGGRAIGFGLTPLGWHRLIGSDASAAANQTLPLGSTLGIDATMLRTELTAAGNDETAVVARLEAVLSALLARRPPPDPQIVRVDSALRLRPNDVKAFASLAGVTPRTLHRICLRGFGFAPKRLLRRERFLATLGHVRTAVGERVRGALGDAYVDQSHFYRDFRDFMAMSPRQYFSAERRLMAAAAAAQVMAGVTLSFELPPPDGSMQS